MPPSQPPVSPSALNRFLGCEYRTYVEILVGRGDLEAERRRPTMQLLLDRGNRHEDQIVKRFREEGRDLVAIAVDDEHGKRPPKTQLATQTIEAMREGREVIHQGCFLHDGWVGYPDFLIRVDEPSDLGDWSYEVADAKLGSTPRPAYIFQLLFYNEQLQRIQGRAPSRMRLLLGDGTDPAYAATDFDAYAAQINAAFAARRAELAAMDEPPQVVYPYKVSDCEFCDWWQHCEDKRRTDDHLSLVANLAKDQGLKLEAHGVRRIADLAALTPDAVVPRLKASTAAALRAQADLQLRSRGLDRPLVELLKPDVDTGLARLPKPSPGDVHFDFEGDQFWGDEGLEYLWGTVYDGPGPHPPDAETSAPGGPDEGATYWPLWATTRAEEKVALETWIDWLTARLEQYPDLHVFHYNSYEKTALRHLVARHATREHEFDELLRRNVFVDLYGITRQAIRAGVESYGLKGIEPVYGFERNAELKGAIGSMRHWQAFQTDDDRAHLRPIALYNRDDCLSTRALYAWLLKRIPEAEAQHEVTIDALLPEPPKPPTPALAQHLADLERLRGPLLGKLPDDESLDTPEQRAYRNALDLMGYHRREGKPVYWAMFDRRGQTPEQLRFEDGDAIGELTVIDGPNEPTAKSYEWTLSFPEQEHKLGAGGVDDQAAQCRGTIGTFDESTRTLVYRRNRDAGPVAPRSLGPGGPVPTAAQETALVRFAERIADRGLEPCGMLDAGADLLLRRAPRFVPGTPPLRDEPFDLERLRAQVRGLDRSTLVIQGPPGTGKTWTGARIATDLLGRGLRVGVMSTSHKAINNLLSAIDGAADEEGVTFRGWKKINKDEQSYETSRGRIVSGKTLPRDDGTGRPVTLIGATGWHWAHTDAADDPVDVLLIDEAGQVSLADSIAVSQSARSVVLLGDPQQLAHVSQGTHPHGSGASVLAHLLGEGQTVPRDHGVFLGTSWRMHPAVCDFISRAMYDHSLEARAGNDVQRISSPGLSGSGLRLYPCEHDDNRGRSPEEAEVIAAEIAKLTAPGSTFVDREGVEHPLTLDDILVVAPYNAQVRLLRSKLPDGARVGTVDKFQGQEAPIVFFSMTASSGEDVSRGLAFLFSRNRLNVAVSRAQALAVVVCSPKLLSARCTTVDDMRLVNMLCQFAEAASR